MPSRTITLTSDFGLRDGYAAAMKGAIFSICPGAQVVDITHDLPPYDVPHAAFVLGTTCPYFPPETVHVAVVDPGVGTARRALLLVTSHGTYIAPDNGLLTYILMACGASSGISGTKGLPESAFMQPVKYPMPQGCKAYVLDREEYWRKPVSSNFHGRDIFAPVAAHLYAGVAPGDLGTEVEGVIGLHIPYPRKAGRTTQGYVIYIDRFGNLVSNIRPSDIAAAEVLVEVEGREIQGLSKAYAEKSNLLALVGSHGYLEVALREGNAAQHLDAGVGSKVRVAAG